ncbi:sporulation integral membrane protein YtvI [Melghirimyces profundicolus]|uniref:Sporulation integral membrane protein YtvI n=1 Tax=Melghirimyces profundicolus TaxID=1242148 RepID=A0A2T6C4J3_9BACL|nr:sporulation integral membrane protein YtvI [Melghirimyces profundicolus]PTX63228.1 sporulation integral membrane protein YtvI [Melghirimyces profundicolus]
MDRTAAVSIALRASLVVGVAILAYYIVIFSFPLTYPFLIGWLIAMMVEPAVRWLEARIRLPRWAGVTLTLVLVMGSLLTLLVILASRIVIELTKLAERLPDIFNRFNQYLIDTFVNENNELTRMIHTIQEYMQKNPEQSSEIMTSIRDNLGVITDKGTQMITDILAGIGIFLGNLPYYATVLVFIILAAFFIGLDWPRLKEAILRLIPKRIRSTGGVVYSDLRKALLGFIRAQLTLILITGVLVWFGLTLLGVDYALVLALIIGAVDLLPYFGVGAVLVPWWGYLMLTGDFRFGLGIGILYVVIVVVRQFLEPKLVATNIGLDPLFTLVALFVGLKLIGVIGLIIGPVVAVILIALYRAGVFSDLWNFVIHGRTGGRPAG